MSCINTILIPAAIPRKSLRPSAPRLASLRLPLPPLAPFHACARVLVRCVNARTGWPTSSSASSRESLIRRSGATCYSHSGYTFPPSIYSCLFSPVASRSPSFSLSLSLSLCLSLCLCLSLSLLLARVFPFSAFPARRSAPCAAPLILLSRIALLCIISIAAGRPEVHIPYGTLVGLSYTYWMYACLHVGALMRSERKVSRGGRAEVEAEGPRRECALSIFTYFVRARCAHTRAHM